jgi:hypothetical protein
MSYGYNKGREQLGRFIGNGNCWVGSPGNGLRGWQVTCRECGHVSKPIARRRGDMLNPDGIARKLANQGWKIGSQPSGDTCQRCQSKYREAFFDERERERNREKLTHLHGVITTLDRYLNEHVALLGAAEFNDEQLTLINEFGSLLATAFIWGIVPTQWKEVREEPKPEPAPAPSAINVDELAAKAYAEGRADAMRTLALASPLQKPLIEHFTSASDQERARFWTWLRAHYGRNEATDNGVPKPPAPKPDEQPKPPPPVPAPEQPVPLTISRSAAEHLARMRSQLNGSTAKH